MAASTAAQDLETARPVRPMWFVPGDDRAAYALIDQLDSSRLDGLDPRRFNTRSLIRAVRDAERGDPRAMVAAETMLNRALVVYAASLRSRSSSEWKIIDKAAVPSVPSASALLSQAAAAPSLTAWIEAMPYMHHSYGEMRRALLDAQQQGDDRAVQLLRINLDRARMLPGSGGRYVLMNAAAQRLYMYENGKVVDSMRVVVGKPQQPTPMMAALIRYTATNPYWNVPADLTAERIAPNVVKEGLGYLKDRGYVVLSDYGDEATQVDPSTINWEAVAAGKIQLRVRQNPGPHNSMGRMKFMFPNSDGVYLHDTPNKELLSEASRLFSGGCVRLEDAPRLAKWLYGKPLKIPTGGKPEQKVDLERPVPVYLAYLTAVPSGSEVVYYEDIYGKDSARLAAMESPRVAAR
ncbi:L,D-transpeptidase family protein [Sphingomonas sp. LY29]|uniref:L,D-transpeptidase family protein n=1 Tax=Sphingomonas sp. LY29 TaxID=3095341 RepID=UPI002D78713A|nr:L,D-transpeptidase family protein [Sphingomonas sp. LY29]WRP26538.1 L,D-transpeptidase family protein [Sphingomonas sp. LY29]